MFRMTPTRQGVLPKAPRSSSTFLDFSEVEPDAMELDGDALDAESERVRLAAAETLREATADGRFESALQATAAERGTVGEDAAVEYRDGSEPRIYSHMKSNPWRPTEPVGPPPQHVLDARAKPAAPEPPVPPRRPQSWLHRGTVGLGTTMAV